MITYLMCKNRGYENPQIISLYGRNRKTDIFSDCDHVAVAFDYKNKIIIIDPWIGIADFIDNIKLK